MGLFVGPFEECRDGGLGGPLPQRFDNVVDAGFHADGSVEHLLGDVDAPVEVAAGTQHKGEPGVAVHLPAQVGGVGGADRFLGVALDGLTMFDGTRSCAGLLFGRIDELAGHVASPVGSLCRSSLPPG